MKYDKTNLSESVYKYYDDSLFENYVKGYLEIKRMEKMELRIKKLKRILDEKSYSIR